MPTNLIAPTPRPRTPRPVLTLAAQLLVIVTVAAGAISLESTTNDTLASAAQEVAGP